MKKSSGWREEASRGPRFDRTRCAGMSEVISSSIQAPNERKRLNFVSRIYYHDILLAYDEYEGFSEAQCVLFEHIRIVCRILSAITNPIGVSSFHTNSIGILSSTPRYG